MGPAHPAAARPVLLLTGASSGIGATVATRLAAQGRWRLLLSGRDPQRLELVAARSGGTALPVDLAAPGGSERLADAARRHADRVDVLVAGAGIGWAGPFTTMPGEMIDQVIAVNLSAVLHLVRLVLPGMVRRGRGQILLVSSVAGDLGVRDEAVYSATKAALNTFAECLRYELAGTPLRVSVVLPGPVQTPFFARRGVPYRRSHPRPVHPQVVANAIVAALARGPAEVYVPGWLRWPGRLRGIAPGVFRRLARHYG